MYTIGDVKKVLVKDNEWFMEYMRGKSIISKLNGKLELIRSLGK